MESSSSPRYAQQYDERLFELLVSELKIEQFIGVAGRCGYSFARKRHKHLDPQFVDEYTAEALYQLCIIWFEKRDEFDRHVNKDAFLRMKIGFELKMYDLRIPASSYYRGRDTNGLCKPASGVPVDYKAQLDYSQVEFEILETVLRTDEDAQIVLHAQEGHHYNKIAQMMGLHKHYVRKALKRIRDDIIAYSQDF